MRLASGTRLGPYEIQSAIGAGGMGEVYQARDTRLDRTVAIKVLPAGLANDRERRVRFEREAKTVAALNHPHICTLLDVGDQDGTLFLVMEHLVGDTLADRLRKGPLPLDQVLVVGAQIADGLAAAHRQGVIHRDLKPGNVMLTKAGAKLLDFGLAKLKPETSAMSIAMTALPTQQPATVEGMILGTVPYMSPEQLEGRDADARSDIFSFGAVLYEMLTGQRAFQGQSQPSVMSAILKEDPPPPSSLQPVTPPALERLVRKCLKKDPDARWQTAVDIADELRWVATSSTMVSAPGAPLRTRRRSRQAVAGGLALLLIATLAATGIAVWRLWPQAPVTPSTFLAIPISTSGLTLTTQGLALSPDGQTTAFVAARPGDTPKLFVRRLADSEPQALKDTEKGVKPFFSPDGQQIAFYKDGRIVRVALRGGTPQLVITDPDWVAGEIQFGGVWTTNNQVIFGGGYIRPGIWQVPAEGGRPEELVRGEQNAFYNFPDALPDDKGVVFTVYRGGRSSIGAWSRTGSVREVIKNASRARYLPTGHLLYEEGGSLRVVRFNCDTLQTEGDAKVVVEEVGTAWSTSTWDVSATGTLVYSPPYVGHRRLVWRDRRGNATPLPLKERPYLSLSLSPDNRLLVVGIGEGLRRQLWWGSPDAEPLQPFTYGFDDLYHAFSADGRWVAFTRYEKGRYNVWRAPTDGSGTPEPLTSGDRPEGLPAFSPDGKALLFNTPEPTGDFHVWLKRLDSPGDPRPFIFTPSVHAETHATFSPDGRWVAYESDAGGHGFDVWVKPYPDGQRIQVSTEGGWNPVWNPGGDELFYQSEDSLMSARFANGRPGRPVALFPLQPAPGAIPVYQFAVSRDGQRFLMFDSVESATQPSLIYVLSNWLEPLKAKLAPQR